MANCGRYRREEALNALWKMGVRNYPVFLNLKDDKVGSLNEGIKVWGGRDNILSLLVGRIRRFKPEVIVTQDLNGEYGHNQHKITARAMKYAIDAAADPQQYPDSAELYGAWQVKKLYHHLYKENRIVMDWEKPLESLNGYTALQVAQIGMQEHASQLKYYAVKSHGTYDNSKFGLYFTTVGEDVQKDDFLENIDPQASRTYLEEHADEIARWKEREAQLALAPTLPPSQQTEPDPEAESPEADAPEGSEALSESASAPETGEDVPAASEEAPLPAEADSTPLSGKQTSVGNGSAGRDGAAVLPLIMIGAGMAAVGLGAWYGFSVLRPGHRRRRGYRSGR